MFLGKSSNEAFRHCYRIKLTNTVNRKQQHICSPSIKSKTALKDFLLAYFMVFLFYDVAHSYLIQFLFSSGRSEQVPDSAKSSRKTKIISET